MRSAPARPGFGDYELEEPLLALRLGEQRTLQYPVKIRRLVAGALR
jgi:hypothetical protein